MWTLLRAYTCDIMYAHVRGESWLRSDELNVLYWIIHCCHSLLSTRSLHFKICTGVKEAVWIKGYSITPKISIFEKKSHY